MKKNLMIALAISLGTLSSLSAMQCGGMVSKKKVKETIDNTVYVRKTFYQSYHEGNAGKELFITRLKNTQTNKISYCGEISDVCFNQKTGLYEGWLGNSTWLDGDELSSYYNELKTLYKPQ